ncbi:hypothetical protein [Rugamonas apoptosis]|uniref:Regulatory protein, RpfE type n=1 Tax=Rugamonas apoptosis TaxID=2758570 RepID=A0A7W2F9W2_9BURK|nr:hypothetical protein [Rugamonas apoptosis]MBA5687838.1 hypothetical protein [Rugamonas apoptosis]
MTQITLALPFALPPSELAPDLHRALELPALAALLSRTAAESRETIDTGARALPYEAWLARSLGLHDGAPTTHGASPVEQSAPLAAAVLAGFGTAPAEGHWFIVHPVHVQMARTHLTLADQRQLRLDETESRALYESARPYFEELGKPLVYGDANTWFMRADDWHGLRTASPDCVTGMNLSDWMPEGEHAIAARKLQNEIQMLWYEHPVNEARQARGLPPVNSFWLWGGATSGQPSTGPAVIAGQPWLRAICPPALRDVSLDTLLAQGGTHPMAVLGQLIEPAIAGEWASWLDHMRQLEQQWFAPLLAALHSGRVSRITLVLSHRHTSASYTTSKLAQRKFWRKPSLTKLST